MFNKFPKKTGIYTIKDSIEHLELKLIFRQINSLVQLPKFDYNKNISPEFRDNEWRNDEDKQDAGEIKEVCIKWQEKIFSAAEEELFKDPKNCITDIQKKYHDRLMGKAETEDHKEESKERNTKRQRNKRQKKIQKVTEKVNRSKKANEIHTYIDEDNFQPKDIGKMEKIENPIRETAVHMYIYATLDIETQLAHLTWYPKERMLHIYPDFNNFIQNPYFIEIDKDYRHLYAFALENISKTRATLLASDLNMYLQLPELRPFWRTEEERSALFAMPPQRMRRVSLLLELREAYNFDHDNIHVRYHVHLPENTIHEEGLLEASTHSSSMSDSGVHHFGYNWQLTLLCEENYDAGDFLHIYFEVISIDSWERERMEGYAFFTVNLFNSTSQKSTLNRLQCLRPVDSFWSSLERFFIGGRRKFDFVRFFGQERAYRNTNDDPELHCRYGCRMQSTGVLEFSCQTFTQRNCDLLESCRGRKTGMTLDDIMNAYREARKRLEALTSK